VPYLRSLGCELPVAGIEGLYRAASLERLSSREFRTS